MLLACWDYLETGEKPFGLSPIENVAFSSFMPDMDEAWSRYIQPLYLRMLDCRRCDLNLLCPAAEAPDAAVTLRRVENGRVCETVQPSTSEHTTSPAENQPFRIADLLHRHAPPNLPEENNRGCCPTE